MAPDETEQKMMLEVFEILDRHEVKNSMNTLLFCVVLHALRNGAGEEEGGRELLQQLFKTVVDGSWDAAHRAVKLVEESRNAGPRH